MRFWRSGCLAVLILFSAFSSSLNAFEIIVRKESTSRHSLRINTDRKQAHSKFEVLKFNSEEEFLEAKKELQEAQIEWEENHIFKADAISHADVVSKSIEANLIELDPIIRKQWSLYNPSISNTFRFYGGDIDWLRARQLSDGKGRLYIVDSGVDKKHPEFEGKFVAAFDATQPGQYPTDKSGHGTHVSSIIAASENGIGIVGVAPGSEVEMIDVRMLRADNKGTTEDALRAFEFVRNDSRAYFESFPDGFAVVNNSWGGPHFSSSLLEAMNDASHPRLLFVTSAGNEASNNDENGYWPCGYNIPNNICVAASDYSDYKTSFSNYGRLTVDILAPGLHIMGAVPGSPHNYKDLSGTSQAAPHVAGAALLVWGANPNLNAAEVKEILLASVDRLPGAEKEVLSAGRLNVYRAVLMAMRHDPSLADREFSSQYESETGGCHLQMNKANPWSLGLIFISIALCLFIYRWRYREV